MLETFDFWDTAPFEDDGWPKLYSIEHRSAHDETNWWVPNRACAEAMLRSAGFAVESHPEEEVYVCRRVAAPVGAAAVYHARGTSA